MAKYPLTERQKGLLRLLPPGFGTRIVEATWLLNFGDDEIWIVSGVDDQAIGIAAE